MDNSIHSIMIYYSGKHTRYYLCLSTFLSLCGYMVVGRLIEVCRQMTDYSETGDGNPCDLSLGLGDVEGFEVDICIKDLRLACENLLYDVLTLLRDSNSITDEDFKALDSIRMLYKEYELRRTEYTGQYYFYIEEEADAANRRYYLACAELRSLQYGLDQEDVRSKYYWYVRGQFIRRMEVLAAVNNNPLPYNIPKMLEKLGEVVSKNPDMFSIYALMGYLAETTQDTSIYAEGYYKKCINAAPDRNGVYLSEVYYRLAHWYDMRNNAGEAYRYYVLSYHTDACNYRALYKIARLCEVELKDENAAKRYYRRIRYMLETIRSAKYIQPVEYEYLFKVYYCLSRIMEHEHNDQEKSGLDAMMLAMREAKPEEMKFFEDFYGKDAGRYFHYMVRRVGCYCNKL